MQPQRGERKEKPGEHLPETITSIVSWSVRTLDGKLKSKDKREVEYWSEDDEIDEGEWKEHANNVKNF